jgi:hypothetical protein
MIDEAARDERIFVGVFFGVYLDRNSSILD